MLERSAVLLYVMRESNSKLDNMSLVLVCLLSCDRLHKCSPPERMLACRAAMRSDWRATLLSRCGPSTRSSVRTVIVLITGQLGSWIADLLMLACGCADTGGPYSNLRGRLPRCT